MLAITAGLIATVVVGKLHPFHQAAWIPEVSFTWWAMIGALVVLAVSAWFRTPEAVRGAMARHARQAALSETVPPALRESAQ